VWGLRLSIHIFRRNRGKPEDYRYQALRQRFRPERYWWVSLFQVFWLQGGLSWIIGLPLLAAQISPTPDRLTVLDGGK
jgi:steroid 5-alpha reductase family enzyme